MAPVRGLLDTAAAHGLTLYTRDTDFVNLPGVDAFVLGTAGFGYGVGKIR